MLEPSKKVPQALVVGLVCVNAHGKLWIRLASFACLGIIHIRAQTKARLWVIPIRPHTVCQLVLIR